MSLTCPLHRSKGSDAQHRYRGGDAVYRGDLGYQDAAEDPGYADRDMSNGGAARPRDLDRSGVHHLQHAVYHRLPVCCYGQLCVSAC